MAIPLDEYRRRVVESGLLSAEELAALERSLPPEQCPQDGAALAAVLHRLGRLTRFQAAAIYQGKHKHLLLGEYEILEKLGAGGMGQVFKARHRAMDRMVALKILPADRVQSAEVVERFHREVRAAARLIHPNIVTAFDAGQANGVHFLVTEYVDGQDLGRIVAEHGPLPIEEAVDCILQAARGLQYAHERGVVHRDVKPGNLMLSREGVVKVLDMGLARLLEPGGAVSVPGEQLTSSGQVMGTVDYMAPEQAQGTHGVDHRADIYSLGCTLYKLLTGQPMYQGDSAVQVLMGHMQGPIPSLQAARPDVPVTLDMVFQRMVAKRPVDRYQSMGEVIAALEQVVAVQPVAASPGERSTDQALRAFFRYVEERASSRGEAETEHRQVLQATKVRPPSQGALSAESFVGWWQRTTGNPWVWAVGAGVLALVLCVLVVLWPKGPTRREASAVRQPKAQVGSRLQHKEGEGSDARARVGSQAVIYVKWPEGLSDARLEVDGQEVKISDVVDTQDRGRLRLELPAGQHRLLIIRRGYLPFEQPVAISAGQELTIAPDWLPTLPGESQPAPSEQMASVSAGESVPGQPTADQVAQAPSQPPPQEPQGPGEQMPTPSSTEARSVGGQTHSGVSASEDPQRVARRKALEDYRRGEMAYRQALEPVLEHLRAWRFEEAVSALKQVQASEGELAERLAVWQKGLEQLARRMPEVIAAINRSGGKLTKRDLNLRGVGGTVTGADREGITAQTITGKTERYPWEEVSPEAWKVLLGLTGDVSGDDWLGAGVHALACGLAQVGRQYLQQAAKLGTDISGVLGGLAAESLAEIDRQYQAVSAALEKRDLKAAEQALGVAERGLGELLSDEATNAWVVKRKPLVEALQAELSAARHHLEAEQLYAQAVELFGQQEFHDVKPLVDKLLAEYVDTPPVLDASRQPNLAQLREVTASLGPRLTVALSGKADFRSIQAAIDAAKGGELIEILDNGPYHELVVIPEAKTGITLRGKRGCFPVITSLVPKPQPNSTLLAVYAPRTNIQRLALLKLDALRGHCMGIGFSEFSVKGVLVYGSIDELEGRDGRRTDISDSLVFGGCQFYSEVVHFSNCLFGANADLSVSNRSIFRSCVIQSLVRLGNGRHEVIDCIVRDIVIDPNAPKQVVRNCAVFGEGRPPEIAENSFVANPMFRDPANLDYRLAPGSPCIGKATDGGDLGVRYTPEFIELCKVALELRARGVIKF